MSEDCKRINLKATELIAELESSSLDSRLEREQAHRILRRLEDKIHSFEAEHFEEIFIQG